MISAKKIPRGYPGKFRENFDISECDENWSKLVLGYQEHESGLSFMMSIILNCTSHPLA